MTGHRKTARAILITRDKRLLLMKRIKNGRLYYVTPGGGLKDGETPLDACRRELAEETGSVCSRISEAFSADGDTFFLAFEDSRVKPYGMEWTKYDSPDNVYEPVEVRLEEFAATDLKPEKVKEKIFALAGEAILAGACG